MPKCDRCGAFMEPAAAACTWCGAGGDNGSAASFVVPAAATALALADAGQSAAASSLSIAPPAAAAKDLNGIGGWLILVAINLVLAPIGLLFALSTDFIFLLGGKIQHVLASHPGVGGMLVFDGIFDVALLAVLIVLNILFYGKKKIFPRWFIVFLAVSVIVSVAIREFMFGYVPTYPSLTAFGSFASACVWIGYFLNSERVKQTFVN